MNDQLNAPFTAISQDLDADLALLTGRDQDRMVALQAILDAVTTRLYQYLHEDTLRLNVTRVLGLTYSDTDVQLLLNVSPAEGIRNKKRAVPEHIRHSLSVRDVMTHLMFTDAGRRTLRPAFTAQLHTVTAVSALLSLSHPDNQLDALLREIVTDMTDTVDLMIGAGLSAADAYQAVLGRREDDRPQVFEVDGQTVHVQPGRTLTA